MERQRVSEIEARMRQLRTENEFTRDSAAFFARTPQWRSGEVIPVSWCRRARLLDA